jgi:stage II sporulation protein D
MGLTRHAVLLCALACLLAWPGLAARAAAEDAPTIRVVLSNGGTQQQLAGSLDWYADGKRVASTKDVATITLAGDAASLESGGRKYAAQRLRAGPADGRFRYGGKEYRGAAELFKGKDGGLVVLNVLPLEDYLLGVVAAEMPPNWAPEALKAQAVAARTFALQRMAARQSLTYDVYATANDQVYLGVKGEDERSTRAVKATVGQVLTYNGQPITAFFCSDAGGCTKLGTEPYLQPVPCANPSSPFSSWTLNLAPAQVDQLISAAGGKTGPVTALAAENDPDSGHLIAITFTGPQGECRITGPKLRKLLGLEAMRSTYARVELPGQPQAAGIAPKAQPGKRAPGKPAPVVKQAQPAGEAATDVLLGPVPASVPGASALPDYARPWVQSGGGLAALKLRGLWCYNGQSVLRCNHEMYVLSADGYAGAVPTEIGEAAAQLAPATPQPSTPVQQSVCSAGEFNGIVIRGSGYGHSLGMSQWGARLLAEQGWDYQRILKYFYSGVELVQWHGSLPSTKVLTEEEAGFYTPFTPGES